MARQNGSDLLKQSGCGFSLARSAGSFQRYGFNSPQLRPGAALLI